MKIKIVTRKMELTPAIESYVEKKISKLSKFFNDEADATVTLSAQKGNHIAELTIYYGGMVFRCEERCDDLYRSIDIIEDLMERQVRKHKTKLEKRLKKNNIVVPEDFAADVAEEKEFTIVKTKKYAKKPMSAEEAILQMNLSGHSFYIFDNSDTGSVAVVYKRNDENYGLIELE